MKSKNSADVKRNDETRVSTISEALGKKNTNMTPAPYVLFKDEKREPGGGATFEEAITATGFGKFNLLLMTLIAIPSGWSSMVASTTNSYIIPVAQCDLQLSLQDKGLLNAITYVGMVSSGLFWGYLSDTLGRKRLLVIGYFIDGCFAILAGMTQSFPVVLFAKFMNGCIINGPFALFTTTLSEFHAAKYRSRILMGMGLVYSTANIVLPLLGWLILTKPIEVILFDGVITWHQWNVFLLICAIPSLFSSIAHTFLPESPKFLMTVGRNEEALEVFKKLYKWNTGNDVNHFPIKNLIDESKLREEQGYKHGGMVTANRTKTQALKEGFQQIKPLFFPPNGIRMFLVCVIQFGIMFGLNTIRLWLPQIFTAISDYEATHTGDANMCTMLNEVHPKNETITCKNDHTHDSVYTNSMIVAVASILAYLTAAYLINIIGKKKIFLLFGLSGGSFAFALYAATNSAFAITVAAFYTSLLGVCTNMCITVIVDLFPTSLRTVTVSLAMMAGRAGALLGNIIFPYLLMLGCFPPFATVGCVVLISILLTMILPNTDLKALE